MKLPKLANYENCTGCGVCAVSCKKGAILFDYDKNGFLLPLIKNDLCIGCGACERKCPIVNEEITTHHLAKEIVTYTGWSNNDEVCKKATSGGVFAQLAIDMIEHESAIVYGAELSNHNTSSHISIDNVGELKRILGTKYIQSDISVIYSDVKSNLNKGRTCLVCGTPCQIAGLYSYLSSKQYDKLLTVELICHGTPSKLVTDMSCEYYHTDHIVSYRDKITGWHKGFSCTYVDNTGNFIRNNGDEFFFKNFGGADRPSCYRCKYARIDRVADITLGDQWGLRDKYSERMNLGANLVLCNTKRGEYWLKRTGNITLFKEKNATLNAPTLFMPIAMSASSISKGLYIIKKLPSFLKFPILSMNWRKGVYLLPWVLWRKIVLKRYSIEFDRTLAETRKKLNWL